MNMKDFKFVTSKGVEVELNSTDMMKIDQYYEVQCTADYLRDNHPEWDEKKVQDIATETRSQMNKYGYDEDEAIEEAIKDYEKENTL